MDASHFDSLSRHLAACGTRRASVSALLGGTLRLLSPSEAAGRKRRKKHKGKKGKKGKQGISPSPSPPDGPPAACAANQVICPVGSAATCCDAGQLCCEAGSESACCSGDRPICCDHRSKAGCCPENKPVCCGPDSLAEDGCCEEGTGCCPIGSGAPCCPRDKVCTATGCESCRELTETCDPDATHVPGVCCGCPDCAQCRDTEKPECAQGDRCCVVSGNPCTGDCECCGLDICDAGVCKSPCPEGHEVCPLAHFEPCCPAGTTCTQAGCVTDQPRTCPAGADTCARPLVFCAEQRPLDCGCFLDIDGNSFCSLGFSCGRECTTHAECEAPPTGTVGSRCVRCPSSCGHNRGVCASPCPTAA
jgi:hypothetical protein